MQFQWRLTPKQTSNKRFVWIARTDRSYGDSTVPGHWFSVKINILSVASGAKTQL